MCLTLSGGIFKESVVKKEVKKKKNPPITILIRVMISNSLGNEEY